MFWGKIREISRVVREVPLGQIRVPENRIRFSVTDESLRQLADSIREHGIIEPILVRRGADEGQPYQLIAGERRLRAAELAELSTVPVVLIEATDVEAATLAIIENLHREDLNFFEEAAAIASLIALSGMTQEETARRLSVSQSYVANKLRLLRLTPAERERILQSSLTERHARALIRLSAGEERLRVLDAMIERQLNVAQAEEYVESILCAESRAAELRDKPDHPSGQKQKMILRDIRLFYNSIDHAVDIIKKSGIAVESTRKELPDGVLISILLPKHTKSLAG